MAMTNKRVIIQYFWVSLAVVATTAVTVAQDATEVLHAYLKQEVSRVAQQSDLRRFQTIDQWEAARNDLKMELADMLGLSPEPARTDLQATTVGTLERDGILVERIHFQAIPGLYVAANLYRPLVVDKPLPTILYVCGHSVQVENRPDGSKISYGNKTGYQKHGSWFARHGYVCLTIDTVQWGEFLGSHWGTYRDGRWDWVSMGYTPAGVETWSGIRALDYLVTRPEVDADRIGLTGRSGGGAYSWFVAALDERVKAVVPVAGITDLEDHVVNNCVSGHCDCMYFINYHGWDYPQLTGLIAPRPLLFANSDNDTIFPLSGVLRTFAQTQHVYDLYGQHHSLGLLITPGPHQDTPELQVGAFRWFERHLKNSDGVIDEAATARFQREELKVFSKLPDDERVTAIAEQFAAPLQQRIGLETDEQLHNKQLVSQMQERGACNWPEHKEPLAEQCMWERSTRQGKWSRWEYTSQSPWRLQAFVFQPQRPTTVVRVKLVNSNSWQQVSQATEVDKPESEIASNETLIYLPVRGFGPHAWSGTPTELNHIARSFYLLGQPLPGMQAWDAARGLEFANKITGVSGNSMILEADEELHGIAFVAAAIGEQRPQFAAITTPTDPATTIPLLGFGQLRNGWQALFGQPTTTSQQQ
jgi:hypothetical protein